MRFMVVRDVLKGAPGHVWSVGDWRPASGGAGIHLTDGVVHLKSPSGKGFKGDFAVRHMKAAQGKVSDANAVIAHYGNGVKEFRMPGTMRHAVVVPDSSEPGRHRFSEYDEKSFSGHRTFDTPHQAVAAMAMSGFTEPAAGSLSKLSKTPSWGEADVRSRLGFSWRRGMRLSGDIVGKSLGVRWSEHPVGAQAGAFPRGSRLREMFDRSPVSDRSYQVDRDGSSHHVPLSVILANVAKTSPEQREVIARKLQEMHDHGEDPHAFLEHLAEGLVSRHHELTAGGHDVSGLGLG